MIFLSRFKMFFFFFFLVSTNMYGIILSTDHIPPVFIICIFFIIFFILCRFINVIYILTMHSTPFHFDVRPIFVSFTRHLRASSRSFLRSPVALIVEHACMLYRVHIDVLTERDIEDEK